MIDDSFEWIHNLEMYDRCISRDLFNTWVFRK